MKQVDGRLKQVDDGDDGDSCRKHFGFVTGLFLYVPTTCRNLNGTKYSFLTSTKKDESCNMTLTILDYDYGTQPEFIGEVRLKLAEMLKKPGTVVVLTSWTRMVCP